MPDTPAACVLSISPSSDTSKTLITHSSLLYCLVFERSTKFYMGSHCDAENFKMEVYERMNSDDVGHHKILTRENIKVTA